MLSNVPIRAILFDIGGPIIDESPDFVRQFEGVKDLIAKELGREISDEEFDEAKNRAIMSWAPSIVRSIFWQFLKPDSEKTNALHRKAIDEVYNLRQDVILMEGVDTVIRTLAKDYILALAANQPAHIKEKLEHTGLLKYFKSTAVSDDLKLSKPDSRFFLEICSRIDVRPEECVMVGDRLDNDIYPANVLGMRTIWVKSGPHAVQESRTPEDLPDATVVKMIEIIDIIERWKKDEGIP
jgi:HAD superfamily hydrolase (TIGR01549 family)